MDQNKQSSAQHINQGQWGETKAREYLISRGFTIAEHDMSIGKKEVDIIALKGDHIHFVEVKTRSSRFVDPADAVNRKKRRNVMTFADNYLRSGNIRHTPQFDIIAIVGDHRADRLDSLEYYPDAWLPGSL